jgi:membrane associated rhomboid family serine protease
MRRVHNGSPEQDEMTCRALISALHSSNDPEAILNEITTDVKKLSIMTQEESREYVHDYLSDMYADFALDAPESLTKRLYYDPETFDVVKMVTSVFAHGSWMHVLGNLFFFFAFAATVEIIVGHVVYPLLIITLAIGTNLTYMFAVSGTATSLPTLGLSGVVMGMIGMFVYFVPKEKIICVWWFLVFLKKLHIPAWLLAAWYVGWDIYDLYGQGTGAGVNLVAHVSGFVLGYLIAAILFKWRKKMLLEEIEENNANKEMCAAMTGYKP